MPDIQIEIDSSSVEERNGKVTLRVRVYEGDVFQCECPVVLAAPFYRDAMNAPGGDTQIFEIVKKRVRDQLASRNARVPIQQALDLGQQRMPPE